mmetsp:Transcript_20788/g.63243  ORF Transcript_20788/g.63243 Transcript_20788/m.63243 type:complete len:145 (-) Transcript_20788:246-680(-)
MYEVEAALQIIGSLGAFASVSLMASPLASIARVLRERSVACMNFNLTLCAFMNGALWTFQGIVLTPDPAIWVPNILGATAGLVQLSLFALFDSEKAGDPPSREAPSAASRSAGLAPTGVIRSVRSRKSPAESVAMDKQWQSQVP